MRVRPLEIPCQETKTLKRSTIVEILSSGEIVIRVDGEKGQVLVCEFLESSTNDQPILHKGDRVLVLTPDDPTEKGCVLGRIGSYRKPDRKHIVIEADEEVTIQCGKGYITIRKSGKVLVKGLEIVSHAKGVNRIRGGSIQLN
ncbi:MAG: hypothetical protein HY203_09080 [Nitrospirae bacterium]|nr:hypothetical protein [Nitrospirota bacterium]